MKNLALTLNKLVAYACDNLMSDSLDKTYTLNRITSLLNEKPIPLCENVTCDLDLPTMEQEIKSDYPNVDIEALTDILLPTPHNTDYYFHDEFNRNKQKAFDFLFNLYNDAGVIGGTDGGDDYIHYSCGAKSTPRPIMLEVGGDSLPYSPTAYGNKIATLSCDDIMTGDVASRLLTYASTYGGVIARDDGDYFSCSASAIEKAKIKKNLESGAVTVDLLDYPALALKISGIAKNAVTERTALIMKNAAANDIHFIAAGAGEKPALYVILCNKITPNDIILSVDPLTYCGVAHTKDYNPLLSVLKKGTALSTDLFEYKKEYGEIGGVKLGEKAEKTLDEYVAKQIIAALKASSADENKIESLLKKD